MRIVAIDTECTGVNFHAEDRPYFLSTCDSTGDVRTWSFRVDYRDRSVEPDRRSISDIQDYLDSYEKLVFHNAKFDIRALASIGVRVESLGWGRIEDTLLLSHIHCNNASHKLKDLCEKYLNIPVDDEKRLLKCIARARTMAKKLGWSVAKNDRPENEGEPWMKVDGWIPGQLYGLGHSNDEDWRLCLADYGIRDVERTLALWMIYDQWLDEQAQDPVNPDFRLAYKRQLEVLPVLIGMESRGVSVRSQSLNENITHYRQRSESLLGELRDIIDEPEFNPRSSPQLQDILYNRLGFSPRKKTKTGNSTDKDTLLKLFQETRHPFLDSLLAFRKSETTANYLESYLEHVHAGFLHSSFNPVGTDTTRLSSSNPNLQNASKGVDFDPDADLGKMMEDDYRVRQVFGPRKGRIWLDLDYDQLQLRIFAYVSGESRLIKAFDEGWDAHNFVASQIYHTDTPSKLQRRVAKSINFGFIFGAQAKKLVAVSGDPNIWKTVNDLFPNAVKFLDDTARQTERCGYVETGGYRLYVPKDHNKGYAKGYTGVCYKVQGLEGLIVKRAMVYWHKYLRDLCKRNGSANFSFLALQVHDELIADFKAQPREELIGYGRKLRSLMERAGLDYGVKTPANLDIVATSWDKSEAIKD